jgi:hypothetical protein
MKLLRTILAAASLCLAYLACSLPSQAGEVEARSSLASDFAAAFAASNFALIESRYAQALATRKRLPGGLFVANRMVTVMFGRDDNAEANGDAAEEKLRTWAARYPKSALPAMALNRLYSRRAWAARGGGYSSAVSEEGWKQFGASMIQANQALLSRAEIGKTDPNWWFEMLSRAQEQGWPMEQYWALANAAIEAFPDNLDIYRAIAMRLVPQWGGSWEALATFADQAAAQTARAEGRTVPARMYWHVAGYFGPGHFIRPQGNWPAVRASFEDLVARYPDNWNLNGYARFACDAGDREAARRMLGRINDSVVPAAWANIAMYNRCRNWALK